MKKKPGKSKNSLSVFSSIGAKLFYLMTSLVLLTVTALTLQSSSKFKGFLSQQLQDSLLMQAERAASDITTIFDGWSGQVSITMPTINVLNSTESSGQLQRFINANDDFLSVHVISLVELPSNDKAAKRVQARILSKAFTEKKIDKKYDGQPQKIRDQLDQTIRNWSERTLASESRFPNAVTSIADVLKLPIGLLGVRFDVPGSKLPVWVVVGYWQTKLTLTLPKSRFTESLIVDNSGRTFTSHYVSDVREKKSARNLAIVEKALQRQSPTGFQDEYRDEDGRAWIGAFASVPRFSGISVIVQRDAEVAFMMVKRTIVNAALWSVLFLLIAIFASFFGASSVTKGLREVVQATQNIASGNFAYRIQPKTRDEVGKLGFAVNHMAGKIIQLMHDQMDKARFEKELETAKMVQSTFFPKKDILVQNLKVTGFYQPASECGGDLWGHFSPRKGVELIFVADAMGHGAPAALVTAMAYATCQAIADILRTNPEFQDAPSSLLQRLNRIIYEAVEGKISMTFWISILDFNKGTMTYSNAGHNFPFIIPEKAEDPRYGKAKKKDGPQPISLVIQGSPLGVEADPVYKEKTMELRAGDKLFFFTDGLIECTNPKGTMWGRKVLMEQLMHVKNEEPEILKKKIIDSAFDYFAGHPCIDDITVVVAEIDKRWSVQQNPQPELKASQPNVLPKAV